MKHIVRITSAWLIVVLLVIPCFGATTLIPGGEAVGLELELENLCITKVKEGQAAQQAGLKAGDCILCVNGVHIKKTQELAEIVGTGNSLIMEIERNGKSMSFTVHPQKTEDGWGIGAEVMDCINGIGTITYFDSKSNKFGMLGHGVNIPNVSETLPVACGKVYAAEAIKVEKSRDGEPGELKGSYAQKAIGNVTKNTEKGLFGTIDCEITQAQTMPATCGEQVHPGEAVIRCCLSNMKVCEYSVQIKEVYPHARNGKDLLLHITDERLLTETGGIVRGMSGSPIIQDGKLVGAVTHVLVNDPTMGYGIFIENMLDAAA